MTGPFSASNEQSSLTAPTFPSLKFQLWIYAGVDADRLTHSGIQALERLVQ